MRSITAVLILLASFPSYSCPFHGLYLLGEDDTTPYPGSITGNIKKENPKFATDIKTRILFQSSNVKSQFKQGQEDNWGQQAQPLSGTSQVPLIEISKPKENLKQKEL